ncbi:MAG TPA: antibiotic biosynthesis monooxygenase [Chitinophagaceae bacterium]|jgi:quinol monooxygenase YgiN|nr:antibiotic biosynthesis monooxygenase [Chitinophagaceae bacterium]
MFVRLTYFGFKPDKLKELKKFYNDVAIPTLKKQKGNLECRLLEPVDKKEDYISMTTWEKKEDADAYHNTGVYKNLVDQVRPFFSKEPVLRVYETEYVMEHA